MMSISSCFSLSHKAMATLRFATLQDGQTAYNGFSQMALTLSALHVYPVKGLKGIDLGEARCTERGLEFDRRWMVVDADGEFLSQREMPKMATVWTDFADGALTL